MNEALTPRVRDGNEADKKGIIALRELVFGEMEKDKCDPRYWNWEFLEGPDGKAWIYLIEAGDQIVGHLADLPRQFAIHGKASPGTLSVDLMVHPGYRRKGFFLKMGRHAIERVKEENRLFMMIYPIRKETIDGFKKLGWHVVLELPVLVYPIDFGGIVQRYVPSRIASLVAGGIASVGYSLFCRGGERKGAKEIELTGVSQFDHRFDRFWEKAISLNPIMGVRDQSFLRWRYTQHPTRTYTTYGATQKGEVVGYIVLRKVDLLRFNSSVIVDLLALDDDVARVLIGAGIEHAAREGADLLGCMIPRVHRYFQVLRRQGFLPSFQKFLLMIYAHGFEELLLKPENWYVNWGDTDVI